MKTLACFLLCGALFPASAGQWAKPAPIPREQGLFRCQIHRGGGRATRPDNSLETFLWCWGHGMAPEADARLTKDGVAIAMHDETFARIGRNITPEFAARKIATLAWDEIKDVDTGSYLDPRFATTRIATMESVFAAMKGRPERLLYVDEKGAPPELIAELANRFGVIGQVYYCSSRWQLIPRWRKIAPLGRSMVWLGNFPKSNSPENVRKTEAFVQQRLDEMERTGFDGIDQVQIHIRTDLTKDDPFCPSSPFIRRAIATMHKYGVTVNGVTWTEGQNVDVHLKIWDLGFDHFTTDYPETLFKVVEMIRSGAQRTTTRKAER
ncbi:MAG: glycerophosphodiester phosphodiesterase [Kiritimatiellia bacterium]